MAYESLSARFNKFLSEIELSSAQIDDAKTKYNGVCTKLHEHYWTGYYNGSTKLLVGSYGKKTAISPPTDIDCIFQIPWEEYSKYDNALWNGQSKLLQDIKSILLEKYSSTDISGDGQVVSVDFYSFRVEVVPGFLLNDGDYITPDTHSGGSWKYISPKTEMSNLTISNRRSNGNTISLIKMIKAWQYNCNVPIKSFVVELLTIDFMETWEHYDKSAIYYDWMIRDFFQYLLSHKNGSCNIPPVYERIYYGDEWESKARMALARANKACEYEDGNYEHAATGEWKKIFGDRFPYPD